MDYLRRKNSAINSNNKLIKNKISYLENNNKLLNRKIKFITDEYKKLLPSLPEQEAERARLVIKQITS